MRFHYNTTPEETIDYLRDSAIRSNAGPQVIDCIDDLRRAFWEQTVEGKRGARNSVGEYPTDTRVAWCDWIDFMSRNGQISQELAQRATLDP